MSAVKTAISLDEEIYQEVERLARELNVSRSRLIALALEDFLRRHQNQKLLREINAAYDESLEEEDRDISRRMRRHFRQVIEREED